MDQNLIKKALKIILFKAFLFYMRIMPFFKRKYYSAFNATTPGASEEPL